MNKKEQSSRQFVLSQIMNLSILLLEEHHEAYHS